MDCCLILVVVKCDGDVDKNIFVLKFINVIIKVVFSELVIIWLKFIIVVLCEIFLFFKELIFVVFIGIMSKEIENILIVYMIIKYV